MNLFTYKILFGSLLLSTTTMAQSVYMPTYFNAANTLDRIETLSGSFSNELHLTTQPIHQKNIGKYLFQQKSNIYNSSLSNVDMYEINKLLYAQPEWLSELGGNTLYQTSDNKIAPFYNNPAQLLEVSKRNFYLSVNPKLGLGYISEAGMQYAAGLELKSTIGHKVGLYMEYTYNSEALPPWYHQFYLDNGYIPDRVGHTQDGLMTYHLPRGHVNVAVLKDYVNFTLGYGQHKIGDGFRSLMLSDYTQPSFFAKLQTQIWKIKYENLYSIYRAQNVFQPLTANMGASEQKYATTHHLSVNVFPWLNVGVFESVIFGRADRYEFGYLNPIVFYRSIERSMGSPDKIIVGLNAKAIPTKAVNVYGQFVLNEFSASEFLGSNKYWANKWGAQLGVKYYNALGISNLDLQVEGNVVRPFTYSSNIKLGGDVLTNYTHYNQYLAHPLGAAFREAVVVLKYQPTRKWKADARLMFYQQTEEHNADSLSYGSNPLRDYDTRYTNYGVKMVDDARAKTVLMGNVTIGYEFMMNTYLELGATYRSVDSKLHPQASRNDLLLSLGFRMNLSRRDFNQF